MLSHDSMPGMLGACDCLKLIRCRHHEQLALYGQSMLLIIYAWHAHDICLACYAKCFAANQPVAAHLVLARRPRTSITRANTGWVT
jgi:hypothetical protein